jgi:membrane protein YdbS with pleckstrin-like domain
VKTKELFPVQRWLWKSIFQVFLVWSIGAAFIAFMAFVISMDEGFPFIRAAFYGIGGWTPFLIIGWILLPPYYNRLRYLIHPDEVVVEVGIITQSVKHVPFRTVTNIQVSRGPFDRLLGIGTLKIQTAGMSGQSGAEESLVGLEDVTSVYQEVATALRRYRQAMPATGAGEEESFEKIEGNGALLEEVRSIRTLLEERAN